LTVPAFADVTAEVGSAWYSSVPSMSRNAWRSGAICGVCQWSSPSAQARLLRLHSVQPSSLMLMFCTRRLDPSACYDSTPRFLLAAGPGRQPQCPSSSHLFPARQSRFFSPPRGVIFFIYWPCCCLTLAMLVLVTGKPRCPHEPAPSCLPPLLARERCGTSAQRACYSCPTFLLTAVWTGREQLQRLLVSKRETLFMLRV